MAFLSPVPISCQTYLICSTFSKGTPCTLFIFPKHAQTHLGLPLTHTSVTLFGSKMERGKAYIFLSGQTYLICSTFLKGTPSTLLNLPEARIDSTWTPIHLRRKIQEKRRRRTHTSSLFGVARTSFALPSLKALHAHYYIFL